MKEKSREGDSSVGSTSVLNRNKKREDSGKNEESA